MKENDWQLLRYFLLWLVLTFMVSLSFYGFFGKWEKYFKTNCYKLFAIISFALLQSSCFNLHVYFRRFCQIPIIERPSLNRNEKVICDNCRTQTTKLSLARHKKRCSVGTLYCTQCPNFSRKSQDDLKYHFTKKHRTPKPDVTLKCNFCYQEFPGFHALRQHRNTQHGMEIGSRTRDEDVEHKVGDVGDHRLREEWPSCQYFLVDSELERARHKVFNYAVETLNETIVNEKFDHFFNNVKCAAKLNMAFGFILKNIEDGGFRYFYAHENSTLLHRSQLVWTHDDLANLRDFLNKTDVIEFCSRERMNTKWRFYKLRNLTVFAALLKDVSVGCKFYQNLYWEVVQSTVSRMRKIQDNHITTTFASFVRLLSICMALNDWKKKLQNCSTDSSLKWMVWAPINSRESTWTIILLLKIC